MLAKYDKCYYKVRQVLQIKVRQFYYKVLQTFFFCQMVRILSILKVFKERTIAAVCCVNKTITFKRKVAQIISFLEVFVLGWLKVKQS